MGQLFELSSAPRGKQMILADYEQTLWQMVLRWAGERLGRVEEKDYPLICGEGETGYFRYGVSAEKQNDRKKKIDEWRLCHPKLTFFWDKTLKEFWYACNTKKTVNGRVFCLSWERESLVVKLPSGRRLHFQKAEMIYEGERWMLRVMESAEGKTERKKSYYMYEVLERLAEAAVEEIVMKKANIFRRMGACVVCTSRRKLLFYMDKDAIQIQDRGLLKSILRLDDMDLEPLVAYGGGQENAV